MNKSISILLLSLYSFALCQESKLSYDDLTAIEKKKYQPKKIVEKKEDNEINLTIKDSKNLNKTTELAVIIKKLKSIRDKKLDNNKKSKKINKEIRKLDETIDLAEDLFKKELLDL